jgi:hypothetical protein
LRETGNNTAKFNAGGKNCRMDAQKKKKNPDVMTNRKFGTFEEYPEERYIESIFSEAVVQKLRK